MPKTKKETTARPATDETKGAAAGTRRESMDLPQPLEDQRAYVAELVEWEKESYEPTAVIGGPNGPCVD